MKIDRKTMLATLESVRSGLSSFKELLEQSCSFVFKEGRVYTFNGEVSLNAELKMSEGNEVNFAVPAEDLVKLLAKLPDEEIDIELKTGEFIIVGSKRKAGLKIEKEIFLPLDNVEAPGNWIAFPERLLPLMMMGAMSCGKDETQFLTVCVHFTPNAIEASDNYKIFRAELETGFKKEMLIRADSILDLKKHKPTHMSFSKNWAHFKNKEDVVCSIRIHRGKYFDTSPFFKTKGTPIKMPGNLAEIVDRARVLGDNYVTSSNSEVSINLSESLLILSAHKATGWYEEKKRVKYTGRDISFSINPQLLLDLMAHTRDAIVSETNTLTIQTKEFSLIVALRVLE